MDTSTIGKSVFDEALALARRRIQSHAARSVPWRKRQSKSAYIFQPEYYSGLSGKTLRSIKSRKTFEEHGLELLRTRKDEATRQA